MQSIGKHKYSTVYQFICSVRDRYITINQTTQPTFLNSEPALACCGSESCQMSLESIKRCIKTRWDALACYYYDYYTHWHFLKSCGTYMPNGTERVKFHIYLKFVIFCQETIKIYFPIILINLSSIFIR